MPGLPVMLNLRGQRCLIVGGGPVAIRRARALIEAGCDQVIIVAPKIEPQLRQMPVKIEQRTVRESDLAEVRLIVLATNDSAVNERMAKQARALGVLVNRADDAVESEVTFMSQSHHGPITLAIDTGSAMPDVARAIRDELASALDSDWSAILEIAGPCRQIIRRAFCDPSQRRERITRLTDATAIATFKTQGPRAYRELCSSLCNPAFALPSVVALA